MSTVTGTYTVSVKPAVAPPPPLAITPATGVLADETEGQALVSAVIATVSGGVPPYSYSISGQPSGVTFTEVPSADGVAGDADVVIGGTPDVGSAAGSPYTITVQATDSAGATVSGAVTKKIA